MPSLVGSEMCIRDRTSVAAFPGGHKAVHGRIEVLADLLSKGNLFIACLIGGTDKAVGILQGFEAIGQHTFPLDKGVLCLSLIHI